MSPIHLGLMLEGVFLVEDSVTIVHFGPTSMLLLYGKFNNQPAWQNTVNIALGGLIPAEQLCAYHINERSKAGNAIT
jgi:hypothetical protein